jgi:DNA invertase Pin-like site-specific DNA recombinase
VDEEWWGYARVSTDEQAEEGVSLEAQEDRIRDFAAIQGLGLTRVIRDPGWSAKTLERPGMIEVVDGLSSGRLAGIVIYKLDRLTRDLGDWMTLLKAHFMSPGGPRLVSTSEAIETRTAGGRFVLAILMAVAQHEREVIVERTGSAMNHKRKRGERLGTVPFGWSVGECGKKLEVCEVEVNTLAIMRNLKESGWKLREIAAELDRLNIKPRSGKKWAVSTISKLMAY